MKWIRFVLMGAVLIGGGSPQMASSEVVTLINPCGENASFEVDQNASFISVLDQIQLFFEQKTKNHENLVCMDESSIEKGVSFNNPSFDFELSHAGITVRSKKASWRDYHIIVSKAEKKDISYILTTLAENSLLSIGTSKSSLEKAGKRIDHLHPYRFLLTIFEDERLKAAVHAIRDRGGWTWGGFIDGITKSLMEEAGKNNLFQFTSDFAQKVKIDEGLILPTLQQGKWTEFVNILIDKIPREINPNRYDM